MDPSYLHNSSTGASTVAPPGVSEFCQTCHQPILPEYYFCPNCGAKVHAPPLSTSIGTQIGIYAFSIILPMICFIFVTRWPGQTYYKSSDPKARQIGQVAWTLILLSTAFTIYLVVILTKALIASSVASINADFGS